MRQFTLRAPFGLQAAKVMAIFRRMTCRGRYCSITFWFLLVAAAAVEVNDELPPGVLDDMLGQEYFMETISDPEPDLFRTRDLLLYRLIKSLQSGRDNSLFDYRPWESSTFQKPMNHLIHNNDMEMIEPDAITKRLTEGMKKSVTKIEFNPIQKIRLQQKWKIKKGKNAGSHMVCYFKLCAFRSPLRK